MRNVEVKVKFGSKLFKLKAPINIVLFYPSK